jgi:NNP family nitrate/nitrite transporter-like MFS transporter
MRFKDFVRSGHPPTLLMAFLYFDVSFMVWVLLGVLGLFVAGDFGLSDAGKGLLAAVPVLGGALARIPMGILVDRIGPKRTGLVGQALVLVALAWAWLGGRTLPELYALGALLGVAGGSFAVALPLASRWYPPEQQGLALGIAGAGNSGTVLAALFAPRLAEAVGWHAVFGWALLPVSVVMVLFALFAREAPSRPAPRRLSEYLELLRRRETVWFCLLYGFTFGGFVGLASFLVIFFHDQYGVGRVAAGNLAALCVFAGSFLRPVGGFWADRLGGARVLTGVLMLASLGLAALALQPPLVPATALLFLVMGSLGIGNGSVFQIVPQRYRKDIGAATGVIGAAGGLGGFLLPTLLGFLKQYAGNFGAGLFCLSLAGAYGLALVAFQRERWSGAPALAEAGDR